MKIIGVRTLKFPEIKVIKYTRFRDERGYFTETYRRSDFNKLDFLKDQDFPQTNLSFSKKNTIRGLHIQWNPYVGKLVRTVYGRMVDLILDIRKKSPNYGRIIAYDMPLNQDQDFGELIWIPHGFAHGNFFLEETVIEYMCTGEYNPACEVCISPLSSDIDWLVCDPGLYGLFNQTINNGPLISEKDKTGLTVQQWKSNLRSENFIYSHIF